MQEAWRTYLELATGLGEASRKQVRKVVKDAIGRGNATAEQMRAITSDLVAANVANREALTKLVKFEVDRALGRVGLATADEVGELTARVHDLERQLRTAQTASRSPAKAVAKKTTAAKAAPAKKTTAAKKVTAAKKAPARKAQP